MTFTRPVHAFLLLVALAAGGVLLPVVHDVAHSGERAAWVAQTHGDHHHHDLASAHGGEVQPVCPESGDLTLACVMCHAPAATATAQARVEASMADASPQEAPEARAEDAARGGAAARGPPSA